MYKKCHVGFANASIYIRAILFFLCVCQDATKTPTVGNTLVGKSSFTAVARGPSEGSKVLEDESISTALKWRKAVREEAPCL